MFIHRWIKTAAAGPLFGLSFLAGVMAALRRLRAEIDVVHTHQGLWEAVATGLSRRLLAGRPTLVQPASSGYYGEADELRRTRGPGCSAAPSWPIRPSRRSRPTSSGSGGTSGLPRPDVRMASGVDAERVPPGPSGVEAGLLPARAVFTGRLHPQKNLPLLLEAWTEVARQSTANLILVGPGNDRQHLEAMAGSLGIADRVQFTGGVDDPSDYLRAADLFVLPSVAEGMSNSLLEAMATALPCVASGIAGNTDLIEDGRTGRLVGEPTAAAWSKVLLDCWRTRPESRRLGEAARRRIDEAFALPVVVDRYVDLYRRMIAGTWP